MAENVGEVSEEFKNVTWKIPDFFNLPAQVDYFVKSPEFPFENATWCLKLYPNGDSDFESYGYIDIYLDRVRSSVPVHHLHYAVGFKTRCGEEHDRWTSESMFEESSSTWGVYNYAQRSEVQAEGTELLPNGTLTVFCQMSLNALEDSSRPQQQQNELTSSELQESFSQTSTKTEEQKALKGAQNLQLDYKKLLKSEEDSDVCLKVSGKEFRAHRCILRARSEVFSAMFKHETLEKASGEVVIEDLDPDSFPDFLQHVYAGRVENLTDENVVNLYLAADKYDMQGLMSECREYMKNKLSVDIFCDVLMVSVRHNEEELLKIATDYFSANIADIVVTVKWQRLLRDHPTEANELLVKSFGRK